MSVKGKVKRCNKEIRRLQDELETYRLSNRRLKQKLDAQNNNEMLENIIKFAITNHIGNLKGGMMISCEGIDKMNDLTLDIEHNIFEHAYIMRVRY